jgi:hypothetical protein
MPKRSSAFFKAVGEAQQNAAEPPMFTLPTRPAPPGPAEQIEGEQDIKHSGTQVPEKSGTQKTKKLGTQGIRYSSSQGIKGLGTQGIESRNAKSSSAEYSRLGVYIQADLHRRLKAHAALAGREISDIAAQAFLEYLARAEKKAQHHAETENH